MTITGYAVLTPAQQESILALTQRVASHDGACPLNEEATLAITGGAGSHMCAWDKDTLVAYAYVDQDGAGSSAQILVDPGHRRQTIATQLVARLGADTDLWAFGNLEPAQLFCAAQGFTPVRGLLVMERDMSTAGIPDDVAPTPGGDPAFGRTTNGDVRLTGWNDQDLDALVRLNARTFASHPEQGKLTRDDFLARMQSDWFDPEGLLLATNSQGQLIGFHWTKVDHDVGEVYVLGVDPDYEGMGVGRRLLDAGLAHMADLGVHTVKLWVEDDNLAAQSLYVKSGFSPIRSDIRYRRITGGPCEPNERHLPDLY